MIGSVADEAEAAALVCVLRCDMRSSLDENLLPHTSFPFIQLQTCADDGAADREGVGVVAAPLTVDTVEDAGGEAAEVGSSVGGGRAGPESGGGSKSPDGYGKGGGRIPAAAA